MKKKNSALLFLGLASVISLVACGGNNQNKSDSDSESQVWTGDAFKNYLTRASRSDNYIINVNNGGEIIYHYNDKIDYHKYGSYMKGEESDHGYVVNGNQGLYKFTLGEDNSLIMGEVASSNPSIGLDYVSVTATSLIGDQGDWDRDPGNPLKWYCEDTAMLKAAASAMHSDELDTYADRLILEFDDTVPDTATLTLPMEIYGTTINETIVIGNFGEAKNQVLEDYSKNPKTIEKFALTDEYKEYMLHAGGELFPVDQFTYAVSPRYYSQYDEFQLWDLASGDNTQYWHDYLTANGWSVGSSDDEFSGGYRYRTYTKEDRDENGNVKHVYTASTKWSSSEYLASVYSSAYAGEIYWKGLFMWDVYVDIYYTNDDVNDMTADYGFLSFEPASEPTSVIVQDLTQYYIENGNDTRKFYYVRYKFKSAEDASAAREAYNGLYKESDWNDFTYDGSGYYYMKRFNKEGLEDRVSMYLDESDSTTLYVEYLALNWTYYTAQSLSDHWRQFAYEKCNISMPAFNFIDDVKSLEHNDFTLYTQSVFGEDLYAYENCSFYMGAHMDAYNAAVNYEKLIVQAGFEAKATDGKVYTIKDDGLAEYKKLSEDKVYTLDIDIQVGNSSSTYFTIYFNLYKTGVKD